MAKKDEIKKIDDDTKRLIQEMVKKEGLERALKKLGLKEDIIKNIVSEASKSPVAMHARLSQEEKELLDNELLEAAKYGKAQTVKLLIEDGADINAKDKYGNTPLIIAARDDRAEIVKILIENGAEVNAKNEKGETPLYWVLCNDNTEIAKFLIEKGADVKAKSCFGYTPLDFANVDVLNFLKERKKKPKKE